MKTFKEKMKDLVNEYLKIGMTINSAKKCALLAIKEVEKGGLLILRYELNEEKLSKKHIEHCNKLRAYVNQL